MKKILVLGSGLVSGPLVRYLLNQPDLHVTVADQDAARAQKQAGSSPRGQALSLDANNLESLQDAIVPADIVVSLLPWTLHPIVARICLNLNKHLVTTSYVSAQMRSMDAEARSKGLMFFNEMGVDPGLDHMAAMRVIREVQEKGGEIESFSSYCGGLPAPESNNNPLGYKFSWSPVGALLATTNDGQYLKNGETIRVKGSRLFEHYELIDTPGAGVFEAYVNRDALPYLELYGIQSAKSIFRGTLRNVGYCETWDYFKKLGLLNRQIKFDFRETTPRQVIGNLIGSDGEDIVGDIARRLQIPEYALSIKKLKWLGLLDDVRLPLETVSVFDMFAYALQQKLVYKAGETDLLIQHHEFLARGADQSREKITSTLIAYGEPNGDASMARTVGLPAAIAVRLIAQNQVCLPGVRIPVVPELYEPILKELEEFDIRFEERRSPAADGKSELLN